MSLTTFCAVDLTGFAVAGPLSTSRYELEVLIAPGLRFVSCGNEVWVGGADCGGGLKLPFRWLEGCERRGGGLGPGTEGAPGGGGYAWPLRPGDGPGGGGKLV